MSQTAGFQETLRRLAMIDEGFVEDQARLGLGLVSASGLDPRTAALLQVGASVAIGSPAVCLEWATARALAAGASEDEIAHVLLAIAPVVGLGLGLVSASALDPRTAALLQVGASVAIGSPAVCLEWATARALAAGASEDEIAHVLLAIAPVVGLGRVVCAAPDVATALGYDITAALEDPNDP